MVFELFKPGSPVLKMILHVESVYVTNELINSNFSDNAVCLRNVGYCAKILLLYAIPAEALSFVCTFTCLVFVFVPLDMYILMNFFSFRGALTDNDATTSTRTTKTTTPPTAINQQTSRFTNTSPRRFN